MLSPCNSSTFVTFKSLNPVNEVTPSIMVIWSDRLAPRHKASASGEQSDSGGTPARRIISTRTRQYTFIHRVSAVAIEQ